MIQADGQRAVAVVDEHVLDRLRLAQGHFRQTCQKRAVADHALFDVGVLRSRLWRTGWPPTQFNVTDEFVMVIGTIPSNQSFTSDLSCAAAQPANKSPFGLAADSDRCWPGRR